MSEKNLSKQKEKPKNKRSFHMIHDKKNKSKKKRKIQTRETNSIITDDTLTATALSSDSSNKNEKKIKRDKPFMEKLHIPECEFSWDDKTNQVTCTNTETSSDEEEILEEESKQKKKKKKLNAAERREQERQKEREIRQREEVLASNQLPNSADQFDRLVFSSPNNSLIWLQYMAYQLQATEIDKARAVARRAVKTINCREENERLNVWKAWLNLESRYGTMESLNDVFQEAVKVNDDFKIYMHMLTVHIDADRQAKLEELIAAIIRKFKRDPQTWIECGTALLKIGLKEKSRDIMQRALQSLPKFQHINLISRFANLENKLGDKERAETLFEEILNSHPKRVDVWSCYVDCLRKSEKIDKARRVLEKACTQELPPKKMKILFNMFMTFEEKYGTPEAVSRVQQMAAAYVDKQCNMN